jgi:hypothetical protein
VDGVAKKRGRKRIHKPGKDKSEDEEEEEKATTTNNLKQKKTSKQPQMEEELPGASSSSSSATTPSSNYEPQASPLSPAPAASEPTSSDSTPHSKKKKMQRYKLPTTSNEIITFSELNEKYGETLKVSKLLKGEPIVRSAENIELPSSLLTDLDLPASETTTTSITTAQKEKEKEPVSEEYKKETPSTFARAEFFERLHGVMHKR